MPVKGIGGIGLLLSQMSRYRYQGKYTEVALMVVTEAILNQVKLHRQRLLLTAAAASTTMSTAPLSVNESSATTASISSESSISLPFYDAASHDSLLETTSTTTIGDTSVVTASATVSTSTTAAVMPPLLSTPETPFQETIVIGIIGHSDIGLADLIQHGVMNNPSFWNNKDSNQQHSTLFTLSDDNSNLTLQRIIFLEINHDLKENDLARCVVHAVLICYDVTQRKSMTGVPDLLNFYHSQRSSLFLLGLWPANSSSSQQVDPTFGERLAQFFSIPFYEMKANDTAELQHVFMKLIRQCILPPPDSHNVVTPAIAITTSLPFDTTPKTRNAKRLENICNNNDDSDNGSNNDKTSNNNKITILAATANAWKIQYSDDQHRHGFDGSMTTSQPSASSISALGDGDDNVNDEETEEGIGSQRHSPVGFVYAPTMAHDDLITKAPTHENTSRKLVTNDLFKDRRGSKDSCESNTSGLTVKTIVDRLITPETCHGDEQMLPIFMIFFRKFMKPYELVQTLIERFEIDLCKPLLPTPQQERIALILCTWLSQYWSDFSHSQTRQQLHLFMERLSSLSLVQLQPIVNTLHPLCYQTLPDDDPDSFWGRNDNDVTDIISHNKKKDSGYMSLYLDNHHHQQKLQHHQPLCNTTFIDQSTKNVTVDNMEPWKQLHSNIALSNASSASNPSMLAACSSSSVSSTSTSPRSSVSSLTTPTKAWMSAAPLPKTVNIDEHSTAILPAASSPSHKVHASTSALSPHSLTSPLSGVTVKSKHRQFKKPHHPTPSSASAENTKAAKPKFAGGIIYLESYKLIRSSPSSPTQTASQQPRRRLMNLSVSSTTSSTSTSRSNGPRQSRAANQPAPIPVPSPSPYYANKYVSAPSSSMSPSSVAIGIHSGGSNPTKLGPVMSRWKLPSNVIVAKNPPDPTSSTCSLSSMSEEDGSSFKFNAKMLFSLPDQEIAEQLTWIEAELFGKIKSREFVRMIWANSDTKQQQPRPTSMTSIYSFDENQNSSHSFVRSHDHHKKKTAPISTMTKSGLLASISHFNFISAWVISMIVTQPKLGKRVAVLEKFMTIAVALRNLNNYNTLMAILAGVNNAAILRLKQTQQAIMKKSTYKRFQSLEKLMSSDRSYCSYRIALKASMSSPCIPYLGIHSQDLIALAEANKDVKIDGTVHWEKFRLMGDCIMTMLNLQQPKYNIYPNSMVLRWIADCEILTEEEQYQQSMRIEPRLKATSMTRLREFWQRI